MVLTLFQRGDRETRVMDRFPQRFLLYSGSGFGNDHNFSLIEIDVDGLDSFDLFQFFL